MQNSRKFLNKDFTVKKYDGLDGKVYVDFTCTESPADPPFKVQISSMGMTFMGASPLICTERDLQDLAFMISEIWQEHRKMAPKLTRGITEV